MAAKYVGSGQVSTSGVFHPAPGFQPLGMEVPVGEQLPGTVILPEGPLGSDQVLATLNIRNLQKLTWGEAEPELTEE